MIVYFIGEKGSNIVKIGKTLGRPTKRMAAIQGSNAHELQLLAVSKAKPEKHYHDMFAKKRIRGEWYSITEDELAAMEDIIFMPPMYPARIIFEWKETMHNRGLSHYVADEYPWGVTEHGEPKPRPDSIPDPFETLRGLRT